MGKRFLVRQKGLEPPTFWFVAKHSIQLSYWRVGALFARPLYYHKFFSLSREIFEVFFVFLFAFPCLFPPLHI